MTTEIKKAVAPDLETYAHSDDERIGQEAAAMAWLEDNGWVSRDLNECTCWDEWWHEEHGSKLGFEALSDHGFTKLGDPYENLIDQLLADAP